MLPSPQIGGGKSVLSVVVGSVVAVSVVVVSVVSDVVELELLDSVAVSAVSVAVSVAVEPTSSALSVVSSLGQPASTVQAKIELRVALRIRGFEPEKCANG